MGVIRAIAPKPRFTDLREVVAFLRTRDDTTHVVFNTRAPERVEQLLSVAHGGTVSFDGSCSQTSLDLFCDYVRSRDASYADIDCGPPRLRVWRDSARVELSGVAHELDTAGAVSLWREHASANRVHGFFKDPTRSAFDALSSLQNAKFSVNLVVSLDAAVKLTVRCAERVRWSSKDVWAWPQECALIVHRVDPEPNERAEVQASFDQCRLLALDE